MYNVYRDANQPTLLGQDVYSVLLLTVSRLYCINGDRLKDGLDQDLQVGLFVRQIQ